MSPMSSSRICPAGLSFRHLPEAALLAGVALLLGVLLTGCGGDFRPSPSTPPGDDEVSEAALREVYDVWIEIADLSLPGRSQPTTLAVDLEITFRNDPLLEGMEIEEPSSPTASIQLVAQYLDGVPLALPEVRSWQPEFERRGDHLRFDPLELFQIEDLTDQLHLEGDLTEDGRRFEGTAVLALAGRMGSANGIRQRNYLIGTTDFAFSGSLSRLRVRYENQFALFTDVEDAYIDPLVRVESGSAFLLNRFELVFTEDGDNRHVEWLSPARNYETIFSFSAGDGSNPQDLVLDTQGRLWLSRYETPYNDLLIADPRTGKRLGSIDLMPWVTGAGLLPRPEQMLVVGDELYVALQNANLSFTEFGPARLLVIDTVGDRVVDAIDLEGINPFQGMERDPATGYLYLAMAGIFPGQQAEQFTGGVEVVDPETRTSLGLLIDDDDLGGHPSDVAIASEDRGYVLISRQSGGDFLTEVIAFDPRDGTILKTVYSGGKDGRNLVTDLEADGEGWLLLALADPVDSGVIILDTRNDDKPIPGARFHTSLFATSIATATGRAPIDPEPPISKIP
ncbi:MAG: hypothetical protein O7F16_00715 [Acidobacteria bacterium]|nr:hypothetical protein [Acidobacteriota bacterium]